MLHKQVQERSQQVEELEEELKRLKSENGQLGDRSRLQEDQIQNLRNINIEQEQQCRQLRLDLDARTLRCEEAEASLEHMNNAIEDIKVSFQKAQVETASKITENTDMRAVIH